MKKLWMLVAIVMMMAVVTTAQAEVRAGSVTVTPFIGGYVFEGNEYNLDPALTYGVRAGYNFTKNLGLEGYFLYILTETDMKWNPNGDDVRIGGYGIEGLFHFFPQSRVVPFLAVGIGGIHYDFQASGNMNKFSVDYGGGVKLFFPDSVAKFFMADDVALRADVRHILPLNDKYNDFLYTAGIAFSFGGKAKSEPAPEAKYEPVIAQSAPKPEKVVILASEPQVEEKVLVAVAEPKIIVLAFEDVHFDFDKSTLKPEARKILKRNIQLLKDNPNAQVRIAGYTSASGTEEYNQKLSERRAKAVEEYLINEGIIAQDRLTMIGYGETNPAVYEAAPKDLYSKAAKANMRVLFEIVVK
jgi:OOP family OmpA-OmpF porin